MNIFSINIKIKKRKLIKIMIIANNYYYLTYYRWELEEDKLIYRTLI